MSRHDPFSHPEPLIRRVYAYVAYRLGDGPDAEDVTSATFERALRYRSKYDRRRGEPAAWLIGIARNCIAEWAQERSSAVAEVPERTAPGDLAADAVRRLDLAAALRLLDERDQELLSLRYGGDLTARQIAELLDERTNTVEVALHRALRRLRVELERERPLEGDGRSPIDAVRI